MNGLVPGTGVVLALAGCLPTVPGTSPSATATPSVPTVFSPVLPTGDTGGTPPSTPPPTQPPIVDLIPSFSRYGAENYGASPVPFGADGSIRWISGGYGHVHTKARRPDGTMVHGPPCPDIVDLGRITASDVKNFSAHV